MQREHQPKNLKAVPSGNQNSLIKKASAQNRAKALKIMRFLGLVASQGGLFPLYGFRRQINKRNRPRDPKRTAGAVFVLRIFISS